MRKRVINIVALFLLAEWLVPSLLANWDVPESPIRVAIFAVFVIALLAAILVSNGSAAKAPE